MPNDLNNKLSSKLNTINELSPISINEAHQLSKRNLRIPLLYVPTLIITLVVIVLAKLSFYMSLIAFIKDQFTFSSTESVALSFAVASMFTSYFVVHVGVMTLLRFIKKYKRSLPQESYIRISPDSIKPIDSKMYKKMIGLGEEYPEIGNYLRKALATRSKIYEFDLIAMDIAGLESILIEIKEAKLQDIYQNELSVKFSTNTI